jgi:hypothetical protein
LTDLPVVKKPIHAIPMNKLWSSKLTVLRIIWSHRGTWRGD